MGHEISKIAIFARNFERSSKIFGSLCPPMPRVMPGLLDYDSVTIGETGH